MTDPTLPQRYFLFSLKLCLDQEFGEEKGKGNGKGRGSNGPEQVDHLTYSIFNFFSLIKS